MFSPNVPKHFWGDAILAATFLINRMPSRVLKFQTPFQILLKYFPSSRILSTIPLKVFGYTSFVHVHHHNHGKLDPRAIQCIFLGYSPHQKGYKCYSPITKRYYHSMDVSFFENQPYYPNTTIQRESEYEKKCLSWDIESSPIHSVPSFVNNTLEVEVQSVNPTPPIFSPNPQSLDLPTNKELHVYSWREGLNIKENLKHYTDSKIQTLTLWKAAIFDEIQALERIKHGKSLICLHRSIQWDAKGFSL